MFYFHPYLGCNQNPVHLRHVGAWPIITAHISLLKAAAANYVFFINFVCHFGNRLRKSDTQRYPVLDSFGPKMPWEVDERIKLTDGTLYRVFLYRSDPSQKPLRFSSQKRADESAANEGVEAPQETGAMWHAAQKNAVSCWGGAVYKHAASSTAESPVLDVTFIFFCTSIIEQNCWSIKQDAEQSPGTRKGISFRLPVALERRWTTCPFSRERILLS